MSAHLVHDDGNGKLAVVTVLLQAGEDNALVRELWKELPKEKEREEVLDQVQIDISRILLHDQSYYTFSGSLTTSPCSEEVTWIVLKHPITISLAKVEQFSQLYRNDARPTQPLYARTVLESQSLLVQKRSGRAFPKPTFSEKISISLRCRLRLICIHHFYPVARRFALMAVFVCTAGQTVSFCQWIGKQIRWTRLRP
jgi:hypothetical protein